MPTVAIQIKIAMAQLWLWITCREHAVPCNNVAVLSKALIVLLRSAMRTGPAKQWPNYILINYT